MEPALEPKDAYPGMYSVIRRMAEEDVRVIFHCFHSHSPVPSHLTLSIVRVGEHSQKLSPPAYEFEPGLYVLLRPGKKKKSKQKQNEHDELPPKAPSHLEHLVMQNFPPEDCPWSLSGPQFPQPSEFQQRYCYPRGRPEYSKNIGSALWTMYRNDRTEDQEYRILHVYYSAKRAANQGASLSSITTKSPPHNVKRIKSASERLPNNASEMISSTTSPASLSSSSHSHEYAPIPIQKSYTPFHGYNFPIHGFGPPPRRYPPPPPSLEFTEDYPHKARYVFLGINSKERPRLAQSTLLARSEFAGASHKSQLERPTTHHQRGELPLLHTMNSEGLDGTGRETLYERALSYQRHSEFRQMHTMALDELDGTSRECPQQRSPTQQQLREPSHDHTERRGEIPHTQTMTPEKLPQIQNMTPEELTYIQNMTPDELKHIRNHTKTSEELPHTRDMTSEELPRIHTMTSEELSHTHTMTFEGGHHQPATSTAENSNGGTKIQHSGGTKIQHSPVRRKFRSKSTGSSCDLTEVDMDELELNEDSLRDMDFVWDNLSPNPGKNDSQEITLSAFRAKQLDPALMTQLQELQKSVQQLILQTPNVDDRQGLLHMVTTWAGGLAKDPFKSTMHRAPNQETGTSSTAKSGVASISQPPPHVEL